MRIRLSDHFTYGRLLRFVFPSVAMMVFTSIYGVVDGFFVSNFAGKTAFAAINLIMPFLMLLGSLGFMFGTGGSALAARLLGEGNPVRANRCFSMMVLLTVVCGVALSAAGMICLRPVARFLGATDAMMQDCVTYGTILLSFNTVFMLQNVFQSFLIAAEKPKLGLGITVAAGMTNIVLDALFVGVFGWGLIGAAAATVISQSVGGLSPLVYFLRPNGSLLRLCRTKPEAKPVLRACANGSSELMSNVSMSLVGILYNFQLLRLVGEDGIAAYGVLMYVSFIFAAIFIGYSIGCAPIISYHFGADNRAELKNMLRKSLVVMGGAGCALTVLAMALAGPLSALYVGYDAALFMMTKRALRLFSFSFLLAGQNIFASSFFTALNNGGVSAAISFLRTLLFQTLAVLILPELWGMDGIWLAVSAAEILTAAVSAAFLLRGRRRYGY